MEEQKEKKNYESNIYCLIHSKVLIDVNTMTGDIYLDMYNMSQSNRIY